MMTRKVLTHHQPGYLSEPIVEHRPAYNLRSANCREQQSYRHTADENKDWLQGFQSLCADHMEQPSTFTTMHYNYFQLLKPTQDTCLAAYMVDRWLSDDWRRLRLICTIMNSICPNEFEPRRPAIDIWLIDW